MDTYLYFAGIDGGGGGADGTGQCYLAKATNLRGVVPVNTTSTAILFDSGIQANDDADSRIDQIVVTHANTTTTTGHRCKIIARAIASATNASPHVDGIVDVIDVDNDIYYDGLRAISVDTGFDMVITLAEA